MLTLPAPARVSRSMASPGAEPAVGEMKAEGSIQTFSIMAAETAGVCLQQHKRWLLEQQSDPSLMDLFDGATEATGTSRDGRQPTCSPAYRADGCSCAARPFNASTRICECRCRMEERKKSVHSIVDGRCSMGWIWIAMDATDAEGASCIAGSPAASSCCSYCSYCSTAMFPPFCCSAMLAGPAPAATEAPPATAVSMARCSSFVQQTCTSTAGCCSKFASR